LKLTQNDKNTEGVLGLKRNTIFVATLNQFHYI
jgi:hypothetical protein